MNVRGLRRVIGTVAVLVALGALGSACASSNAAPKSATSGSGLSGLVGREAPDFTLLDQFGRSQRLSDYRGKVVLLTFVSSRCKNICPLTAELLARTQDLLGGRAHDVQLLAVNVNTIYNSVPDVLVWSRQHAMTHRWLFLTGSEPTLTPVYRAYSITPGSEHTTVVLLIDRRGRVRGIVPTAMRGGLDAEARVLTRYVKMLEPT